MAAASLAVQLSYDAYSFTGIAEAAGWAERAEMLVDGKPPSVATAFVPYIKAYLALNAHHDPDSALAGSQAAARLARDVGATDLEMLALALAGLAKVSLGHVDEGMRGLDAAAAAAVSGEMTDADSIVTVCCMLIDACKRVGDLERAEEWCIRVRGIAERFGDRQMFSVCRTHFADMLLSGGDWLEAEHELTAAIEELGRLRPGRDADALVRLAELRRRQGRVAEAEELLGRSTAHRFHILVTGLVALGRGNALAAQQAADRYLRRVGTRDRFERVAGLDLRVRAALSLGDYATAHADAQELWTISSFTSGGYLRATALLAAGRVALAERELDAARESLEDAADLFDEIGARFDGAIARAELAAALALAGLHAASHDATGRAQTALRTLGAAISTGAAGDLSPREHEVLRLLAQGLSNDDIARRLVLSVRTVERHVANLYAKIGVSGRTARASATAWAYSHGIA